MMRIRNVNVLIRNQMKKAAKKRKKKKRNLHLAHRPVKLIKRISKI
ncbi:hypothetical protein FWK35_00010421, partial [Aphis craccivora]